MIRRPWVSQPLSCDHDGALDRASLGPRRMGSEYGGAALHRGPAQHDCSLDRSLGGHGV